MWNCGGRQNDSASQKGRDVNCINVSRIGQRDGESQLKPKNIILTEKRWPFVPVHKL